MNIQCVQGVKQRLSGNTNHSATDADKLLTGRNTENKYRFITTIISHPTNYNLIIVCFMTTTKNADAFSA